MEFTVGFIFTQNLEEILLILKDRPSWQAGLWNGIGGKVEKDETSITGISREVFEETGIHIAEQSWKTVGNIVGNNWQVTVFTTILIEKREPEQKTSEKPAWHNYKKIPSNIIPNLSVIIPACVHVLTTDKPPLLTLTYND